MILAGINYVKQQMQRYQLKRNTLEGATSIITYDWDLKAM